MNFKKYLFVLSLLSFTFISYQGIGQDKIYRMAQKAPQPRTGLEAFHDYVAKNVQMQKKGVSGNVFVQFVVEKDGKLSNIKVLKGVGGSACNNAVIKVLQSAPRWYPGKQNGKPVRVKKVLAVKI